jgi:hypothetical protein
MGGREHVISIDELMQVTQMVVCYHIATKFMVAVPEHVNSSRAYLLPLDVGCMGSVVCRINHPGNGQSANVRPLSMVHVNGTRTLPVLDPITKCYTLPATLRIVAPVKKGEELLFDYGSEKDLLV